MLVLQQAAAVRVRRQRLLPEPRGPRHQFLLAGPPARRPTAQGHCGRRHRRGLGPDCAGDHQSAGGGERGAIPHEFAPTRRRAIGPNANDQRHLTLFPFFPPTGVNSRWRGLAPSLFCWRNPMSQNPNPFLRGYWNLKIVRSDFAVVSNGPDSVSAEVLAERDAGEGAYGVVGAVVYAIHGDDFDGRPVHIGDTYSAEAAREVVQRLSFETGYYSRCWEISSAHISHETGQYLANLA